MKRCSRCHGYLPATGYYFYRDCYKQDGFRSECKDCYNGTNYFSTPSEKKGGQMKKVMIIDGLNMFLRSYIVVPSMDPRGNPSGGTYGFMKSLQKICGKFQPDEIVVCWDGQGGSQKRKEIDKNYKEGRSPVRFNRRLIDLSPEETEKNKYNQQMRLMEYLNDLPVIQTMIDFVEADDCISYIAQHARYSGWEKIIVSSDKDFLHWVEQKLLWVNHERYQISSNGFPQEQLTLDNYLAENHVALLTEYYQSEKGCV